LKRRRTGCDPRYEKGKRCGFLWGPKLFWIPGPGNFKVPSLECGDGCLQPAAGSEMLEAVRGASAS
jgi:hypothetical protein